MKKNNIPVEDIFHYQIQVILKWKLEKKNA